MQGLKLIQVSEAGPGHFFSILLMDGSELTQEGQVVYLTHKNYGASSESIKSACFMYDFDGAVGSVIAPKYITTETLKTNAVCIHLPSNL